MQYTSFFQSETHGLDESRIEILGDGWGADGVAGGRIAIAIYQRDTSSAKSGRQLIIGRCRITGCTYCNGEFTPGSSNITPYIV
jgi:hypothetical protein